MSIASEETFDQIREGRSSLGLQKSDVVSRAIRILLRVRARDVRNWELEASAEKYVWRQTTHFRARCRNVGSTNHISVTGKEYVNVTCPDGREYRIAPNFRGAKFSRIGSF